MNFVLISDNELSDDLMDFEKNLITNLEILNREDILEIHRRRRLFYDKAIKNLLTKETFVDHLEREKKLLHICKLRIFDVNEDNRKMLRTLSNRLNCIYYAMISYKFYDIELISDYIKFAEAFDRYLDIKSPFILQHLISLPQCNAQMYLICARHLLIVYQSAEVALGYLSMGRKSYPECTELVVEQFYVEAKCLYKGIEDETSIQAIAIKYNEFTKYFNNDVTYDIGLLNVILNFPMHNLHSAIIRDIITRYHSSVLMWHKLAELHLQGFNYDFISQLVTYDSNMNKLTQIQNCFGVYEKGLIVNMPFYKKKLLSDFYLDTLIKLITTCNTKNDEVITYLKDSIDTMFNRACNYGFVNKADHFIFWAENSKSGPLKPLKKSVKILKQNTVLWEKLLIYLLNKHLTHEASLIFFQGVKCLGNNSIHLWRLMEMYILNNSTKIVTKDFYELGMVMEFDEINIEYRNKYLDWCFITYGINIVRRVFNAFINHNMLCLELYMKMINIELLQCPNEIDHNHIRDLYVKASDRYGHDRFEIWIDFIKYERSIGDFEYADKVYKNSLIFMKPEFRKRLMDAKDQLDTATIKSEPMDL